LCYIPLAQAVEKTKKITEIIKSKKNTENLIEMRGTIFKICFEMYTNLSNLKPTFKSAIGLTEKKYNIGIIILNYISFFQNYLLLI
jgi:hypothetical protein